jgi:hypothetical protein
MGVKINVPFSFAAQFNLLPDKTDNTKWLIQYGINRKPFLTLNNNLLPIEAESYIPYSLEARQYLKLHHTLEPG